MSDAHRFLTIAFGRDFALANQTLSDGCSSAYTYLLALPAQVRELQRVARRTETAEDGGHFAGDLSKLVAKAEAMIKQMDDFSEDLTNAVARLAGMD